MIWLRRALTIPSGLLFFLLLLATLVLLQVNDTFLNPDYYPEELRKASIYEFVLGDLLTSALDEARALDAGKVSEELDENPLVTSGLSTEEIVSSVNRAIPPEWVQGQVEAALDEVTPYLVGEKDSFTVTVRAGAQVATMVDEVQGRACCGRRTPTTCCSTGWWSLRSRGSWRSRTCRWESSYPPTG